VMDDVTDVRPTTGRPSGVVHLTVSPLAHVTRAHSASQGLTLVRFQLIVSTFCGGMSWVIRGGFQWFLLGFSDKTGISG